MSTTIDRWKRAYAVCLDCELLHPESSRILVRQHAGGLGHRARYVVEDRTDYAPLKDGQCGRRGCRCSNGQQP